MNEPLLDWLDTWGSWLDELLASGLACPSRSTRQSIERWCEDADLLGFTSQARLARGLFEQAGISTADFQQLLLEHDMLERLYQVRRLAPVDTDSCVHCL